MKKTKKRKKGPNDQYTDFIIIFSLFFLLLVVLSACRNLSYHDAISADSKILQQHRNGKASR